MAVNNSTICMYLQGRLPERALEGVGGVQWIEHRFYIRNIIIIAANPDRSANTLTHRISVVMPQCWCGCVYEFVYLETLCMRLYIWDVFVFLCEYMAWKTTCQVLVSNAYKWRQLKHLECHKRASASHIYTTRSISHTQIKVISFPLSAIERRLYLLR